MNGRAKKILVVIGILFLVGAPLCFLAAGAYSYAQPAQFQAATGFHLLFPAEDAPRLAGAFQQAQQQYPARVQAPLAVRVELLASGTSDRYGITAIGADPLDAASAANMLTMLVSDNLRETSKAHGFRVRILQKAEVPKAPSNAAVQQIMKTGWAAATTCGVCGIVFLGIAFARRKAGSPTT